MINKIGVHLSNEGNLINFNKLPGLKLVKTLVRLDLDYEPTDYERLARTLDKDCSMVLRLFFPGKLISSEYVHRVQDRLPLILSLLQDFETFIEIHNEPNHHEGVDGWGSEEHHAYNFASWYHIVFDDLKQLGYENLGFPGLALGRHHHERLWANINRENIHLSDWLAVHCYWQREEEMERLGLGANWLWYRENFPNKRIIISEAGNSSCHSPWLPQVEEARQAYEYATFCTQADAYGVAFFILDGTEDWSGFQIHDNTLRALKELSK